MGNRFGWRKAPNAMVLRRHPENRMCWPRTKKPANAVFAGLDLVEAAGIELSYWLNSSNKNNEIYCIVTKLELVTPLAL